MKQAEVDKFVSDVLSEAMQITGMSDVYQHDVTFNFAEQRVYIPHHRGTNLKSNIRTVYRVTVEGKNLIGSVLHKGSWNRYKWVAGQAAWYPVNQ